MRFILFLSSALSAAGGVLILVDSKSAIHEIEAFLLFLISAVFFVGFAVVVAINAAEQRIKALMRPPSSSTPTFLD